MTSTTPLTEPKTDIPLNLPTKEVIHGLHPIIIIGPNGSGKTSFANKIALNTQAGWIGATRNLQLPDSIENKTPDQANHDVRRQDQRQKSSPWSLSNEISSLLAKIKAEDAESAIRFRDQSLKGVQKSPKLTKSIQLTKTWNSVFPKRSIDFASYSPKIRTNHQGENQSDVSISRMSGGERVALYLLAKVLDAPPGLIFIDEPEIHFHQLLAKKFWDQIEQLRTDCRFVYITHDLSFANSRKDAQFIIIKSKSDITRLKPNETLPNELVETLLGAATFSVSAKKVIFCEGSKKNKSDAAVYSLLFESEETAIIPVGSCTEVVKCVEVFNSNTITQNITAYGIIDRDFQPESYLNTLPKEIFILPYHEFESLLCTEDLFILVGTTLGKKNLNNLYREVIQEMVSAYSEESLDKNKLILERVKQNTEYVYKKNLNALNNPSQTIKEIKSNYIYKLNPKNWDLTAEQIFQKEVSIIESALQSKNIEELLRLIPGKVFFNKICQTLGISPSTFIDITLSILEKSTIKENENYKDTLKKLIMPEKY